MEYVRRAVRTIGRCAIKLEGAAEACIKVLLQLIQTKVNYVVQEAVVVIRDIFRRYPNRYESIIGVLCSCLESLDEPEAKAAMIWIIGEYADRIDNAGELLGSFTDSFHEETTPVQLQLLTATVKLFLKRPSESEELVQSVLSLATEHSDNPDLRDRGYIYWRLLSTDPDAAKAVVLAERPVISDDSGVLEPGLLEALIRNLSTLASVYHKPPEAFVRRPRPLGAGEGGEGEEEDEVTYDDSEVTGGAAPAGGSGEGGAGSGAGAAPSISGNDDDLLGLGGGSSAPAPARGATGGSSGLDDFFGMGSSSAPSSSVSSSVPSHPVLGEKDGLVLRGALARRGGAPVLELVVQHDAGAAPVASMALKFNVNAAGLAPASPAVAYSPPVGAGSSGVTVIPLVHNPALAAPPGSPTDVIQAAIKDNASGRVVFFAIPLAYTACLGEEGSGVDKAGFVGVWRELGGDKEAAEVAREVASTDAGVVQSRLAGGRVSFIASRPGPSPELTMHYFSASALDGSPLLFELTLKVGLPAIKIVAKSPAGEPATKLGIAAVKALLK